MAGEGADSRLVVVAAALVHHGRVLAARRSRPQEMAGRWELPGGKVEAGEDEPAAVRRECQEELGVSVDVGSRVGPPSDLSGGGVLHGWWARLRDGEPAARADHDALLWLAAEEVDDVDWLPADRPLVRSVAAGLVRDGGRGAGP